MRNRFRWVDYNVSGLMPNNWQSSLIEAAWKHNKKRVLSGRHSTSREGLDSPSVHIYTVPGKVVQDEVPWLADMYSTTFRKLAEQAFGVAAYCAIDERYALTINVQFNNGHHYECHVDTNPIEGLLYATTHVPGSGGELVIANDISATDRTGVNLDCSIIYPEAGRLIFFDARKNPHYVRRLTAGDIRVVAAMNFYTDTCTEQVRPPDLNEYLYGYLSPQAQPPPFLGSELSKSPHAEI